MNPQVGDLVKVRFDSYPPYVGIVVWISEESDWGFTLYEDSALCRYGILFRGHSDIIPVWRSEIVEIINTVAP